MRFDGYPEGAVWVSTILYSSTVAIGKAYFQDIVLEKVSAETWSDEDVNQLAQEGQLTYTPADGAVVTTNPPSFVWLPIAGAQSYTLEYSSDPNFGPDETIRVDEINISIYTPAETFNSDSTWYWRVRGVNAEGIVSAPSVTRAFRVASNASPLPLPPLSEVRDQLIKKSHPRLFVTEDTLETWRESKTADLLYRTLWSSIRSRAHLLKYEELPAEPPHPRQGGVWDVNLWRQFSTTVKATDDMETLAFAYMMTGDPEYGEAARRWMMHIASWDPAGATSAAANDESSMPILLKLSRAYTWANDALTSEERQFIRDVIRIRGTEAYKILARRPFESNPYESHAGRSLGLLGEAAIAFLGEFPEAAEWFDYVVSIFYAVYPAWGGDPGGWAEGHAYWTSYMNRVTWFVDALQAVTDLNLYYKPFFQNTGYFKLYTQPPYSQIGPFGDFADRGPGTADGSIMSHFANVYQNPHYRWYAERLGSVVDTGVMGYIRQILHPTGQLKGQAPLDLPSSAVFSDVGWVAMHKRLGDSTDAIQFMFKSSPFGSFSHSLADQNTFTLEAYGEPLAISSGYRPWYGSNHYMNWTKATQAHNGILVNGRGQIIQSIDAKGEITSFVHGKSFDYTAGDATQAYGGLLDRYIRHVVYVRPDIFVIFDDLKSREESTFSWLMHAYQKMEVDEASGHIRVDAKRATLDVQLWSSEPITYTQTDQFAVPLDEPMNKPIQWHLNASTDVAAPKAYFLAVLTPSKQGDSRLVKLKRYVSDHAVGVQLEDDRNRTSIYFRKETGSVVTDLLTFSGSVAGLRFDEDEGVSGLLLIEGAKWESKDGWRLTASTDIDAELTIDRLEGSGNVHISGTLISPAGPDTKPFDVVLHVPYIFDNYSIYSEHPIVQSNFEEGDISLKLAPGEHQIKIELSKAD